MMRFSGRPIPARTLRVRPIGAELTLAAALLTAILVGCGGGGSGPSGVTSRSYLFSSNGQTVAISLDTSGRFTIFARDADKFAEGAGAHGSIDVSTGQFTAQGDDPAIRFSGTIAKDGSGATGTVTKSGSNAILFSAAPVSARGVTSSTYAGTFSGSAGTSSAFLSVDTTSHATLYVNVNGTIGGGLMELGDSGILTSTDSSTVANLTPGASSYTLVISKLNGTAVNVSLPVNRSNRARWTFMVYLNAANDLQTFSPLNVNQMETVGSTPDVNIVVQWKQANCSNCNSGPEYPPPAWFGTRRYFVTKDGDTTAVHSQLLQDLGTGVDMGDWRTLRTFISWSQQNYPADHYALVIWNHGAGWRNTRSERDRLKQVPRSVSIDEDRNTEIEVWDLPQALNVTPKMDLVIFDASLMQMTEVAYELRNSATYIVGSEESPPGEGYVYSTFLGDLAANPNMSPQAFGKQIVDRTVEAYPTDPLITQSEIDASKMQAVADALNAFGNSLLNHIGDSAPAMQNARNNAEHYKYFDNKDLWDYAGLIKAGASASDLKSTAANVQSAIAGAVLDYKDSAYHQNSRGLAIYVPDPAAYLSTYTYLALGRTTSWPQWLQNQP